MSKYQNDNNETIQKQICDKMQQKAKFKNNSTKTKPTKFNNKHRKADTMLRTFIAKPWHRQILKQILPKDAVDKDRILFDPTVSARLVKYLNSMPKNVQSKTDYLSHPARLEYIVNNISDLNDLFKPDIVEILNKYGILTAPDMLNLTNQDIQSIIAETGHRDSVYSIIRNYQALHKTT